MNLRLCKKCGLEQPISNFRNLYKDKYAHECKECKRKYNYNLRNVNIKVSTEKYAARRYARKLKAIEYLGGVCRNCHKSYAPVVYDFHHIDPATKDRISQNILTRTEKAMFLELDKCVLLCANCHRVHHFSEVVRG